MSLLGFTQDKVYNKIFVLFCNNDYSACSDLMWTCDLHDLNLLVFLLTINQNINCIWSAYVSFEWKGELISYEWQEAYQGELIWGSYFWNVLIALKCQNDCTYSSGHYYETDSCMLALHNADFILRFLWLRFTCSLVTGTCRTKWETPNKKNMSLFSVPLLVDIWLKNSD
jgi:hypothetical protein